LTGVDLNFLGNILIRTDGGTEFIFSGLAYTDWYNLSGNGDIGFVNFASRDLHLTIASEAIGFAVGIENYPEADIDGDLRDAILDAGADQN